MAYEREAIADSTTVSPNISTSIIREEKTIDPYRNRMGSPTTPVQEAKQNFGQTNTLGETKVVDTAKSPEETVRLSPQAAALARKEQKFRQQQHALEKEKESLAAEKAELAQLRAMREKLAAKDYSGLEGLVDYNDYSQYQVNKANGSDPIKEELNRVNSKLSEMEKFQQENIEKQFEAAVSERRHATSQLINNSNDFPRVKKLGEQGREAIVHHILDTWENDQVELSVEQAAKEVERELGEYAKNWASLLEDEKEAVETEQKRQLPPMKQGLKTLTNSVTSSEFKNSKPLYHMTDGERWAEARRRAEAKLQQNSR